ncbi:unnamed protein product [Diabrotica balteata]|uniref:SH3 and multiple ankyrin repeat domains protein 3 n=1 Tax=Diabrotica balteata TaxID=107213 RepID=A0A9P0DTY5_DIABA|nr:unnamed protein product [Diabrotica balteata]
MSIFWKKRKRKEILEDMWSFTSTSTCEELARLMEEEDERGPEEGHLLVRIHVPELNVQKCLQFPRDQLVWDVKQQCLAALPKELKESFNYGLFCPPDNGRAGKFLDEERRLGDYPFNGPVGYLELKYKRRVYKMMSLDEKQLKSLHTRANLRRFIDYVQNGQVEKITKICSKGLDPNFHCQETGETPLTIATGIKKPAKVLMALVNGGALLDYRKKDGSTALHRSVEHRSLEALKTLLELGASPNYKDNKGLTPLYYTITLVVDPTFTETLLHDHATTGAQDAQGWQEVHQACRTGLQAHLEHLLFYGADMNAKNASGNTPLHVCAVNGQESCARQLLFRGADRQALNYANQTPCQVAVIAGNMELAEIIQKYKQEDVDKSLGDTSDIISDSSGVGTANSDTTNCTIWMPGSTVVCIESYTSKEDGHISIREGDIIEVLAATDDGYLEGKIKSGGGRTGYFPASCAQEVRLRHHNIQAPMMVAKDPRPPSQTSSRVLGRRESTSKHFATAPRATKKSFANLPAEPRTVVLHKGKKGFGFILRGAKATSPLMDLTPSDKCPALQYLDDVDPGGVADIAGLKKGDFLLEINNEDVSSASHEHVVDLIRKSGDLVQMTVMSLGPPVCGVLPMSKSTILPGGTSTIPLSSRFATLPRKAVNYGGTLGRSTQAPLPPRRDPKTTLSVGRARAKSMVAGLGGEKDETDDITKSSSAESIHQSTPGSTCTSTPVQPRTASIRQRPSSTSLKHSVLEELFQKQKESNAMSQSSLMSSSRFQCSNSSGSPSKGRVYASVAEMKRSKSKNPKVKFTELFTGGKELKRTFHSTPDLVQDVAYNCQTLPSKFHRSQEDISLLLGNRSLPPPSHPPPPIPSQVQLVKVDVSRGKHSEYDHLNREIPDEGIVSSFNPTASAKLYASPEDMKTVGYRSKSLPSHTSKTQIRKSQSMRTNNTFKPTNNNISNKVPADTQQSNPYAQPIRASRSHSTGSRERRKKVVSSKSNPKLSQQPGAPPIPEPDYSCTDSEGESESVPRKTDSLASRINSIQLQATENSGNSNASGSSSGSSSIPHSFSVEEIQRGRSLLKSSKSYPDDLLKKQKEADAALEDGDNSSSGVSSDQEIMPCGNTELTEQNSIVHGNKNQRAQIGTLKRHAVSLAQLPPPIENETDEKEEFCLPPPPEFGENNPNFSDVVVAPPPQFSDNRQITRVRIVGAVPKGTLAVNTQPKLKQNRLHSQ